MEDTDLASDLMHAEEQVELDVSLWHTLFASSSAGLPYMDLPSPGCSGCSYAIAPAAPSSSQPLSAGHSSATAPDAGTSATLPSMAPAIAAATNAAGRTATVSPELPAPETLTKVEKERIRLRYAQRRFRERRKEKLELLQDELQQKMAEANELAKANKELLQKQRLLAYAVELRERQVNLLSKYGPPEQFSYNATIPGSLSFCRELPEGTPTADADDIARFRSWTPDDIKPKWKVFLSEVSRCLLQLGVNEQDQTAFNCMKRLVGTAAYMCKHVHLFNPPCMHRLKSVNLETGQPEAPPAGHWTSVIGSLQLTPEQVDDLLACGMLYTESLQNLIEERNRLLEVAESALGTSSLEQAQSQYELDSVVQGISTNLHKEHVLAMLVTAYFFGRVITALQWAKVACHSYPYYPDAVPIVLALLQDRGVLAPAC